MSLTLPYLPLSMKWDFTGYPDVLNTAPVADSTFVLNGKTLYVFRLPGNFVYNTAGKYPVVVTVNNPTPDGCLGEQIINFDLEVLDPPTASFSWANTAAAGCTDSLIAFTGINTSSGRSIIKHYWDFGDGSAPGTSFNPSKAFSNPGQFKVRYVAMTDAGCLSDTTEKFISVTRVPVAKFGIPEALCVGKTLTFSDSSTLAGGFGSITNWNWNLGTGSPLNNTSNASVTTGFANTGNYTATLQLKTNTGCLSPVYSLPFTIRPNPAVDFGAAYGCMPNPVINFTNNSTIADGTQNQFTYLWNFGDAASGALNNSSIQNPSHQYSSVGPFTAKLIITSAYGCIDSVTKAVDKIYPQPKADFTAPAEVCWQTPVTFTDASNAFTHPVTKWEWRFSDGTTSTQQNPVKNFTNPGTYTATLWVYSNQNCVSDTVTKTVVVNPWPTAGFTINSLLCEKNAVTFSNTSTANVGTITRTDWYLSSGTIISSNQLAMHTYPAWGDYTIRVVTENSKGCVSDTLTQTVHINPLPNIGFVLPEVCLSDAQAIFNDTSSIADNSEAQMSYLWKFNTGTPAIVPGPLPVTSTGKNPSVKFNKADHYLLSLQVTSKDGCRDSVTAIPFTVNGSIPKADFAVRSANALCSNQDVELEDRSTVDFGNVTKVEIYWDNMNAPSVVEVDDTPAAGKIYKHRYPEFQSPLTKTFQVRYRSYSGILCVNEVIKTITVNASPLTQFSALFGVCVNDVPFQLGQGSEMGGLTGSGVYTGPGVNSNGLFNPLNAGTGTHTIRYTFTAGNGCISTSDQTIEVWPKPTVNAGADLTVLEDGVRKITDVAAAGTGLQFLWSPSTYLNDATLQLPTILQPKDDITYLLTVTNEFGCKETDDLFVKILKSPRPPNTFTPNGDGINDFWEIKFLGDYPGAVIEVYNTAGSVVYRSVGYTTPWDGKYKGQPLPAGTYYYVLDPKNGRKRITGYVTILR
ncbi:MAG: PKD domain-containing protein [Chitinophagaceae bacterium]|nr:PKD domain-containing protein [Chitinophagaceae bacterium]